MDQDFAVLVLADSAERAEHLRSILAVCGCAEVRAFTAARRAQEWALTHEPGLVVIDADRPDLVAFEFIERFREFAGDVPCVLVLCSGAGAGGFHRLALKHGANDFSVNLDTHQLRLKLERYMVQQRAIQSLRREARIERLAREATADLLSIAINNQEKFTGLNY